MRALLSAAALFVASAMASGVAQAQAVQGELGETSTGSFSIELTIDPPPIDFVQISDLSDLGLTESAGSPGVFESPVTQYCVYHSSPTYALEFASATLDQGGFFELAGPADARISYLFDMGPATGIQVLGATTLTGLVANRTEPQCADGGRQQLQIRTYGDTSNDPPGVYSATLQLTVRPE